jgi:glycosyltransferase involved in cell wall biosynthesis
LPLSTRPDGSVDISVVMPCLNEERTLGTCIAKARGALDAIGTLAEIVVADNGSTDASVRVAEEGGARVVHVARRGYGSALQAGIESARGQFIIIGDADDSYDFAGIAPFIAKLRDGADLVMGNRFKGGIEPGAMPWLHRYIGNPILSGILNLLFRTPVGDSHCGLRGFRKTAYAAWRLTTPGMEFASEMVVRACLLGHAVTEVPTTLKKDGRDRPPHLRSFRDGWRHLRFLLMASPRWLYLLPSSLLLAVGFGIMAWLTPGPQMIGTHHGLDLQTMLLGALCVLLGYQTLWLWAFAKIFGWVIGFLPEQTFSVNAFRWMSLERGLLVGFAMLLAGLGLNGWMLLRWVRSDFGPLPLEWSMRVLLWGCTTIVLGVQTIYGSFFLSMLGMTTRARTESG